MPWLTIDGEPWFVAKDVAELPGYSDTDYAIRAHCKAAQTCAGESSGQVRHYKISSERDVYRLVMRSKLPIAPSATSGRCSMTSRGMAQM